MLRSASGRVRRSSTKPRGANAFWIGPCRHATASVTRRSSQMFSRARSKGHPEYCFKLERVGALEPPGGAGDVVGGHLEGANHQLDLGVVGADALLRGQVVVALEEARRRLVVAEAAEALHAHHQRVVGAGEARRARPGLGGLQRRRARGRGRGCCDRSRRRPRRRGSLRGSRAWPSWRGAPAPGPDALRTGARGPPRSSGWRCRPRWGTGRSASSAPACTRRGCRSGSTRRPLRSRPPCRWRGQAGGYGAGPCAGDLRAERGRARSFRGYCLGPLVGLGRSRPTSRDPES